MRIKSDRIPAAMAALLMSLVVALPFPASACRPAGSVPFKPTLEPFDFHGVPGSAPAIREALPAPVIKAVEISRSSSNTSPSLMCGGVGWLRIELGVPASSTYEFDEFGVYFRVIEGEDSYGIFPDIPFAPDRSESTDRGIVRLWWIDYEPHAELDLKIEVFFVTNGLNIGRATVLDISEKEAR